MPTHRSFHCPYCHHTYAPFLVINWAKRVACSKCKRTFRVSPKAFQSNCMLAFAFYSFLPLWLISTVVLHVVPLPDPEGINFWGKLALGAFAAVLLMLCASGVGWVFGDLFEPRRYDPHVKKQRRKELVRCPECGSTNDSSQTDACEQCGEAL